MPRLTPAEPARPLSAVHHPVTLHGSPSSHTALRDAAEPVPASAARPGAPRVTPVAPRRNAGAGLRLDRDLHVPSLLANARPPFAVEMAALLADEAPHLLQPHLHALPVEATAQDPALLAELVRSCVHAGRHPSPAHDARHSRRPWTGPFVVLVQDLLFQDVAPAVIQQLAPVWPVLLNYRVPAQREQLTFHLTRDVLAPEAWARKGATVRALLMEHADKRLRKNALLAELAVLAHADASVLEAPGVRRFLEHRRTCHDGRRLRTVINFVLATEKLDSIRASRLLSLVLGYGGAPHGTSARSLGDAQRAYSQETVPQVLELCALYAAYLRMGLSLRALAPEQRTDPAALRDAIAHALLGAEDAALEPQLRAMLDTWRLPHRLFTFAGQLRSLSDDGVAGELLRRVLRVVLSDGYARERATNSALAALPQALRDTWTAGHAQPLADLPLPAAVRDGLPDGWTLQDGCSIEDFINSGSDVHGSCQDVEGDPSFSQTLLGRMLDGRKRLLMVKSETGEIVARAMFRLLTSRGGPVALLSKPYMASSVTPWQARKLLAAFARQRARALRVPLVAARGAYPAALAWSSDLHASASRGADYWDELSSNEDKAVSRAAVTLPAESLQVLLARGMWD